MKTSHKILLTTAGTLLAFLVVSMLITRMELTEFLEQKNLAQYEVVLEEKFDKLMVSSNWLLRLNQERDYKVEIAMPDSVYAPIVENRNGTLWFSRDSLPMQRHEQIQVRITAPTIRLINGGENVTIDMQNFQEDSLVVSLADGGYFVGFENKIFSTNIKSKGEVTIDIVDNPDM